MTTAREFVNSNISNAQLNTYITDNLGIYNVKDYGAVGDGTTDDSSDISTCEGVADDDGGIVFFPPGTYVISGDITISSNVTLWFADGAKLSIDAGKTVTINGNILAGRQQIFSGSGTVAGNTKLNDGVYPEWWGAIAGTSTSVTDDSTSAIQAACTFASQWGTLNNPTVKLANGHYLVSDTITVPSYVSIAGDGWGSILLAKAASASGFSVLKVTAAEANNIVFSNFAIHGQTATQTQTINGIDFTILTTAGYYCMIENVYIKEMRGKGIYIGGLGMANFRIHNSMIRDSYTNIYATSVDQLSIHDCVIRSAKTGTYGIHLDDSFRDVTIRDCRVQGNASHGIFLDLPATTNGDRVSITDNYISNNGASGIYSSKVGVMDILGNTLYANTTNGTYNIDANYINVKNNTVRINGEFGIAFVNVDNGSIMNNEVRGNSATTDNTHDGIAISDCDDTNIQGNTVRKYEGSGNEQRYGINVIDNTCDRTLVTNNDLINSGKTGTLNDGGTNTNTTAANRVA